MLPLKEAFLELAGTIFNASICYDVWWELQNADNPHHETYAQTARCYALFFEANAGAHLVTMLVLLYQAHERRRDTQNFHSLLRRIESEDVASADLVAQLRRKLDDMPPIWKKVARARSTVIAHLSSNRSSLELMQAADLTPNEIRMLIDVSKAVLRELGAHFGILGTAVLDATAAPHTRDVMRSLARVGAVNAA